MPPRHRDLLHRIFPSIQAPPVTATSAASDKASALTVQAKANENKEGEEEDARYTKASVSPTGTLLVCPVAPRVRGLDLMKELSFDGLSLAFLKNLEKITFVSSASTSGSGSGTGSSGISRTSSAVASSSSSPSGCQRQEYRIEKSLLFEHSEEQHDSFGNTAVLKGVKVVRHRLYDCDIVERLESRSEVDLNKTDAGSITETRRRYRLHSYTIQKYKTSSSSSTSSSASASLSAPKAPPTTTISLAFPVHFVDSVHHGDYGPDGEHEDRVDSDDEA